MSRRLRCATVRTAWDRSSFFGVYCLVFTARVTSDNLAKLRQNEGRADGSVADDVSSMVNSATSGDLSDRNTSVIDAYTGSDAGGGGYDPTVDESHSVMKEKVEKKKKKKAEAKAKEKEEQASEKKPDEDFIDDLF